MNTKTVTAAVVVLILSTVWTSIAQAGRAFTYQVRLTDESGSLGPKRAEPINIFILMSGFVRALRIGMVKPEP